MKVFIISLTILFSMQNILSAQNVLIDIPPREGERDDYCGEICIQEALLYFGMNVSQDTINEAGGQQHIIGLQDQTQITKALNTLGASFEVWRFTSGKEMNYSEYIAFLKEKLSQGFPVLAGVKINPTRHPEWINDHYILIIGFNDDLFIYNSPDTRESMTFSDFESGGHYTLTNSYNIFFGVAFKGIGSTNPPDNNNDEPQENDTQQNSDEGNNNDEPQEHNIQQNSGGGGCNSGLNFLFIILMNIINIAGRKFNVRR